MQEKGQENKTTRRVEQSVKALPAGQASCSSQGQSTEAPGQATSVCWRHLLSSSFHPIGEQRILLHPPLCSETWFFPLTLAPFSSWASTRQAWAISSCADGEMLCKPLGKADSLSVGSVLTNIHLCSFASSHAWSFHPEPSPATSLSGEL